jgi:hypothetical protein
VGIRTRGRCETINFAPIVVSDLYTPLVGEHLSIPGPHAARLPPAGSFRHRTPRITTRFVTLASTVTRCTPFGFCPHRARRGGSFATGLEVFRLVQRQTRPVERDVVYSRATREGLHDIVFSPMPDARPQHPFELSGKVRSLRPWPHPLADPVDRRRHDSDVVAYRRVKQISVCDPPDWSCQTCPS